MNLKKFVSSRISKKTSGFTLIEILVVIGIIAILAAIVVIAINPAKQFAQARNTQRQSGINTILNAVGQRLADNKGIFPSASGCDALPADTSRRNIVTSTVSGSINLSCLAPAYVAVMPTDPDSTFAVSPYTGYDISVDSVGRVTVYASKAAEPAIPGSTEISVTR